MRDWIQYKHDENEEYCGCKKKRVAKIEAKGMNVWHYLSIPSQSTFSEPHFLITDLRHLLCKQNGESKPKLTIGLAT